MYTHFKRRQLFVATIDILTFKTLRKNDILKMLEIPFPRPKKNVLQISIPPVSKIMVPHPDKYCSIPVKNKVNVYLICVFA